MPHTLATILLLSGTLAAPPTELGRYEFEHVQMGVLFKLTLYAPDDATANKAAQAAYARIKELNRIMSDYDPDSELMRLCRSSGPGKPVKVSRELFDVLSQSLEISRQSCGAFDVTVGPYVDLWRKARRRKQLPDPAALKAAAERVGYQHVRLDAAAGTVELLKPNMLLDLGGIAKGYAAGEALAVLRRHGVTRALVAGSGDIVAGDPPPGKPAWRIAVAPLTSAGEKRVDAAAGRFLLLKNAAVATSGDVFQHLEIDGVRYSHIVNPQTGLGLTQPSSVTVVAPNGTTADSLASAVSVLGPECGLRLIDCTPGTTALIVQSQGDRSRTFESKNFRQFDAP
jgi:thiamine biosynthesis lipoprotein